jgi:predicted nucleotidyltransferase
MADIFNPDFQDFINAFNKTNVDYILVGGYSVILHGYSRTTGDMDIWVRQSDENYTKILRAFRVFGMPMFDMTREKFLDKNNFDVFRFGRKPSSIDLMTAVKGLQFHEALAASKKIEIDDIEIQLIHYNHLIAAKKAAGRPKDWNDIENLERQHDSNTDTIGF